MSQPLNTSTDSSGKIKVSVFKEISDFGPEHEISVDVDDPNMVCIGGGGEGAEQPNGALLTASCPNDTGFKGWKASTKEHIVPCQHQAKVYAIGMKIEGFSRDELIQNVKLFTFTSTPAHVPGGAVSLDEEYSLLGGGFEVNYNPGKGNLATGSFPVDSSTWGANSKDMEIPDSCSITVFAIGIKTQLTKRDNTGVDKPTGHIIITKFKSVDSTQAAHPSSSAEVPPGYVLCGGGGEVFYTQGKGNYLWSLEPPLNQDPAPQVFTARSKDHERTDPSVITTSAVGIKMLYVAPPP